MIKNRVFTVMIWMIGHLIEKEAAKFEAKCTL